MPVYIYIICCNDGGQHQKIRAKVHESLVQYINTTNSKSFEKYKIKPIDAKIVSYFLNNVCF